MGWIYTKCTGSLACAQTFSDLKWDQPWYDMCIRKWTRSFASHWTLDRHSHWYPLESQSTPSPDVCSQLNRSHSTRAAVYPLRVKGVSSLNWSLSYEHTRVAWATWQGEKQITLSGETKQSSQDSLSLYRGGGNTEVSRYCSKSSITQ